MPRKGQNPSQGRRAGSTPTAHRVQVTYLIISAAGTAPEVTNGDQVETDATVAEDRHGDSIRIEALPDTEIHNPNLTRLLLKGGDMYTGCRFRASSSSPVLERPPETKRSRRNRRRERVASLSPSFNCSRGREGLAVRTHLRCSSRPIPPRRSVRPRWGNARAAHAAKQASGARTLQQASNLVQHAAQGSATHALPMAEQRSSPSSKHEEQANNS